MSHTRKIILSLALALIVLLYAVVGNSTKIKENDSKNISVVDTSEWGIYSNENYGFQIKHPADWKIDISKQQNLEGLYFSFRNKEEVEIVGLGVFKGSISKDILDKISPRPEVKNLVINDINMINISDTGYDISFERNGLVYYFVQSLFAQEEDGKIIGTILSTFNFLK